MSLEEHSDDSSALDMLEEAEHLRFKAQEAESEAVEQLADEINTTLGDAFDVTVEYDADSGRVSITAEPTSLLDDAESLSEFCGLQLVNKLEYELTTIESHQFGPDVVESGTSKSQRDRIKTLKQLIVEIEEEYTTDGAPIEVVLTRADEIGMGRDKAEDQIDKLRRKGEVYEPKSDHLRTT